MDKRKRFAPPVPRVLHRGRNWQRAQALVCVGVCDDREFKNMQTGPLAPIRDVFAVLPTARGANATFDTRLSLGAAPHSPATRWNPRRFPSLIPIRSRHLSVCQYRWILSASCRVAVQNNVPLLWLNVIHETGCDVINRHGRNTAARRERLLTRALAPEAAANALLLDSFHEYTCASLQPVCCQAQPNRMQCTGTQKSVKKQHSEKN